ncbi:Uncharacterized membrane protein [Flavobacteriaceae bacterium MAR_2010_188]|nr:Uncharacterized membrane protein [Flavobacteriaceae bacterium MAR_2010_188]
MDGIDEGRGLSIVAYITIFGSIVSIFMNIEKKNPFIAFHTRQGLGLCLTFMAMGYVISQLDSLSVSLGFWIFFGVLFIYGSIGAAIGKYYEVPILGPLYQKWFKSIGT